MSLEKDLSALAAHVCRRYGAVSFQTMTLGKLGTAFEFDKVTAIALPFNDRVPEYIRSALDDGWLLQLLAELEIESTFDRPMCQTIARIRDALKDQEQDPIREGGRDRDDEDKDKDKFLPWVHVVLLFLKDKRWALVLGGSIGVAGVVTSAAYPAIHSADEWPVSGWNGDYSIVGTDFPKAGFKYLDLFAIDGKRLGCGSVVGAWSVVTARNVDAAKVRLRGEATPPCGPPWPVRGPRIYATAAEGLQAGESLVVLIDPDGTKLSFAHTLPADAASSWPLAVAPAQSDATGAIPFDCPADLPFDTRGAESNQEAWRGAFVSVAETCPKMAEAYARKLLLDGCASSSRSNITALASLLSEAVTSNWSWCSCPGTSDPARAAGALTGGTIWCSPSGGTVTACSATAAPSVSQTGSTVELVTRVPHAPRAGEAFSLSVSKEDIVMWGGADRCPVSSPPCYYHESTHELDRYGCPAPTMPKPELAAALEENPRWDTLACHGVVECP